MATRPYTFDRVVRMIITLSLVAAGVWLINLLRHVLLPFCVAALISYFLEPLVQYNRSLLRLRSRVPAVFITLFEVAFIVAMIIYLCGPHVVKEINQMAYLIRRYSATHEAMPFVPEWIHRLITGHTDLEALAARLDGQNVDSILDKTANLVSGSIDFLLRVLEWLLTFIYVIFILLDYNRLVRGLKLVVPPKYRHTVYKIGNDIKNSMDRYFRGQALLALCATVLYCVGFSIVGIPLAIIMGVCVGVLYMIPYFQYITLIPVFLICLIDSMGGNGELWVLAGRCGLVYIISQCICDYVLTPKIMGKALGLNPAIILLSLSVWGTLLGIIGMIIALPLTTLCISYYQQYVIDAPAKKQLKNSSAPPSV